MSVVIVSNICWIYVFRSSFYKRLESKMGKYQNDPLFYVKPMDDSNIFTHAMWSCLYFCNLHSAKVGAFPMYPIRVRYSSQDRTQQGYQPLFSRGQISEEICFSWRYGVFENSFPWVPRYDHEMRVYCPLRVRTIEKAPPYIYSHILLVTVVLRSAWYRDHCPILLEKIYS